MGPSRHRGPQAMSVSEVFDAEPPFTREIACASIKRDEEPLVAAQREVASDVLSFPIETR
jgi:hypothetical protein